MARPRIRRIWASTYFLIGAIVAAAAGLAYYSYEYAQEMAQRGEEQILESTNDAAQQRRARIDSLIIDGDRFIFNLVDVENLKDFPRRWSDFGRVSPAVQSVVVLDERLHIAPDGFASKRKKHEAEAFRALLEHRIVNDLGLPSLADGEDRHIDKEYDGRHYLLSFTRRDVGGRRYYVVLEADLGHLYLDAFPVEFQSDSKRFYQIIGENGYVVFGLPFTVPSKYVISLGLSSVPTWTLRMAPRNVPTLAAEEARRRITDWVFIGLSSVTLFVGLGILTYAVRTERRANQLKSDFIANVSHDLKTPLSLIRMYGDLLATGRTKSAESAREYAEIISRESERLSRLIDNVLDFAKIERGRVAYDMKTGDLAEVLARGLDVYRHRLEREGMHLTVEVDEDIPPVKLDENAMTLVLLNLIDNAVKYAADGKEVRVSLSRSGDGERVKLAVADRGPGIDSVDIDRIFERFYRGRRDRARPVRGSGIGLAIVKQITEAHGGEVTVESTPGQGSVFTVSLPVATEESAPPEAARAAQS